VSSAETQVLSVDGVGGVQDRVCRQHGNSAKGFYSQSYVGFDECRAPLRSDGDIFRAGELAARFIPSNRRNTSHKLGER
jgi:hypothetical protein